MRRPSPAIAISLTALVIALSGTAYAAGGKSLILGHRNTAKATTFLRDTKGTPLALGAPADKPPLSVSNSKQIARLNATFLQGKTPAQFGAVESARVTDLPAAGGCVDVTGCLTPFYGAISGSSSAASTQSDADTLSPDQPMVIRNLSALTTTQVLSNDLLQVGVSVSGVTKLTCLIEAGATSCHDGSHAVLVPAGSRLSIVVVENQVFESASFPASDVLAGFTMSPA